jgi:hypothetical protein
VTVLSLPELRTTSPTLAETMSACFLRAGISRTPGNREYVLGNPKAWLGNAYHEVLEKISQVETNKESLQAGIERLWDNAIAAQRQRAEVHPLDRRFGAPETWPGYYVVKATSRLRAEELCTAKPLEPVGTAQKLPSQYQLNIGERDLTAYDARLKGRPDLVRGREVIDYKSGAIYEIDETKQTEVVKSAYIRQLQIYAYLVNSNYGWWPQRGRLLPMVGPGAEVPLDPSDCELAARNAVQLLDSYNEKLLSLKRVDEFGSPSVQNCRWCPYKLLCSAFWRAAVPEWSGKLDGAALEGVVARPPDVIHGNAARAVTINVQRGTEVRRSVTVSPLNLATHPIAETLAVGDQVRLVGLRLRPDGVAVPTQRTMLVRLDDIPTVALPILEP